ncbi:MAG TPA: ABC transporter permease [Acidimicrobiales bacterium]|jgi:branched-chain amino acid transport system permease protein|nr:ABC transporter permease [Acidimicrobiales bacterium]
MNQFISLTVAGIAIYGCVYALTAMGLVVTYTTSGIFNFSQGAVGMLSAFFYYELNQVWHWPSWLALPVCVLGFAPAIGALLERVVVRRLENAGLEAKLTVTIALTILGMAIGNAFWDGSVVRDLPEYFGGGQVGIGGVNLTYQEIIIVIATVVAAAVLRVFFVYSRAGIATRAVVDDRELAALTGASPTRFAQLGWAMGCSLAALAGILVAPSNGSLSVENLTLLVVTGYAAALVGRLKSLPMTFLGACLLGLAVSYGIGYMPSTSGWAGIQAAIPEIFLLVVMLVMPQQRATLTRRVMARAPRIVHLRESLASSAGLVVVAVIVSLFLTGDPLGYATTGVAVAIIALSLTLLTGYGGQVSLCQMTLAGLGAFAMSKVGGTHGSLLGVLAAIGLAAGVGAVLALPSLRLRGLYLALATFAFAEAMDNAFFPQLRFFGATGSLAVARPDIPGLSLTSDRTYLVVEVVVFSLLAIGLLTLRRSRFGRRLSAISDSPSACVTLGVDMTRAKLAVFTLSAGIAGLGGALYGGAETQVQNSEFGSLFSLTLLLLAVVWGIRTTGGMIFGGVSFALGPLLEKHLTHPRDAFELLVGAAAIGISQNPEGTFGGESPLKDWFGPLRHRPAIEPAVVPETVEGRLTHAAG